MSTVVQFYQNWSVIQILVKLSTIKYNENLFLSHYLWTDRDGKAKRQIFEGIHCKCKNYLFHSSVKGIVS
jgi:hypothetical protein